MVNEYQVQLFQDVVTGLKTPHDFAAAALPSEQQPYCVTAQPPASLFGAIDCSGSNTSDVPVGHGFGDVPSLQQPYFVPAHPPTV